MKRLCSALSAAALLLLPDLAYADAIGGEVHRQPLNIQAIVMFILFVGATLYITYWASNAPVPVRTTIPRAGASLACKTAWR